MAKKDNQETTKIDNQSGCLSRLPGALTPREKIVLGTLLENDGNVRITYKTLGVSKQYVNKIRKKAEDLGLYRRLVASVVSGGETGQQGQPKTGKEDTNIQLSNKNNTSSLMCRLHAEKFVLELIQPVAPTWKNHINRQFKFGVCTVNCHKESITIFSNKSFYGESETLALAKSVEYWDSFFTKLENQLGTLLIKERKENLKRVYAEWETINTAIGDVVSNQCDNQLRIYDKVDGKLRLTTDMSLKTLNHETHHHEKGKRDSENVRKFVEDFLEQPQAPTLSELARVVNALADQNKETAAGLNAIVQLIQKPKLEQQESKLQGRPSYLV